MAERPPPTPVAMLIATAIFCGLSGYMIGIFSSLGFLPIPFAPKSLNGSTPRRGKTDGYDDEEESSEEDISEGEAGGLDHAPNWGGSAAAKARGAEKKVVEKKADKEVEVDGKKSWENSNEECKLVLVVRTDLGMTKGKMAAQCSHATLACYKTHLSRTPLNTAAYKTSLLRRWESQGQAKIALQVKSEEELELLQATAISLGLVAEVIADAGRTQIAAGSHTVLGIGPAPKSVVDGITGHLKLL